MVSEELRSQDLAMLHCTYILSWFQRSYVHKILLCYTVHSFKVTQLLQILSNQIKYEQIPLYGFRGVAFTKCHGQTDHYYVGGAPEAKNIQATDEW